jgi:hypothetical protein
MISWGELNRRKRKKKESAAQPERKQFAGLRARMKKRARRKRREVRKALAGAAR